MLRQFSTSISVLFGKLITFLSFFLKLHLVIDIPVLIHELGHYLAYKHLGVGVSNFSIGLGPSVEIFHFRETSFELGLLPFGGYNKPYSKMLENSENWVGLLRIEDLNLSQSAYAAGSGLIAGLLLLPVLFIPEIFERRSLGLLNSLKFQIQRLLLYFIAIMIETFTFARYPRRSSKLYFISCEETCEVNKRPFLTYLRSWKFIVVYLFFLNIFPFGMLDGTKVCHSFCGLCGFNFDLQWYIISTLPMMVLVVVLRNPKYRLHAKKQTTIQYK